MKKILAVGFAAVLLFSSCMFDAAQAPYTSAASNLAINISVKKDNTTKLANMGWLNRKHKEEVKKEA